MTLVKETSETTSKLMTLRYQFVLVASWMFDFSKSSIYITVACRNAEDCTYGERCVQNMCTLPCASHSQCPAVQACVSGTCLIGCRSSKDCPEEHACVNNKCQGKSLFLTDKEFFILTFAFVSLTVPNISLSNVCFVYVT